MSEVSPTNTGRAAGLTQNAWTRSRYDAALARLSVDHDAATAARMATALVTQWALECGWGRAEWDFNLGNITPGSSWRGDVHRLSNGRLYRAYASLDAGLTDTLRLLGSHLYAAAFARLAAGADPVDWYSDLMHAGWNPWSAETLDTYRGTLASVRRILGAPASPSPATTPAPPRTALTLLALGAAVSTVVGGLLLLTRRGTRR